MRILIAEDDLVSQRVLETTLKTWGYQVVVTCDGRAAWEELQCANAPELAILDWMMPAMDGLEVCRRLRSLAGREATYLLLLTAKDRKEDIVRALETGANDYLTKPFDRQELRARVGVGVQMVKLQRRLADRVRDLEDAFARVKHLQGLLPICAYCKKIRDGANYWQQVETYIAAHSEAHFSHGICPNCWEGVVKAELARAGIPVGEPGASATGATSGR